MVERSSWTVPEIYVPRSGIPMMIEIQSDSSKANSLTDRLGAGQRTKHIDTRYFWIQERVQDGHFNIKKSASGAELRRCWNEASLCSSTATMQVCRVGSSTDRASHTSEWLWRLRSGTATSPDSKRRLVRLLKRPRPSA